MDILMPQLGETVTEELKITVWFKAVGDAIARRGATNLFEIERRTKCRDGSRLRRPAGYFRGNSREAGRSGSGERHRGGDWGQRGRLSMTGQLPKSKPRPASLDPYNEVHTPPRNFRASHRSRTEPRRACLRADAWRIRERCRSCVPVKGSGPHWPHSRGRYQRR